MMSAQQLQEIISPNFTEHVLLEIVRKKSACSDIKVIQIQIGAASKKGDSYMSTICRFIVDAVGKNKKGHEEAISIPVIVKFLPKNISRRKTYRCTEFFENEIIFYDKVWSVFEKFQNEAQTEEKFEAPLVLASYYDGTNDFVAMEDLGHYGYKSAERGAGLDWKHTVAILQVLARFHALSLAYKERYPDEFEAAATSLKETYFAERLRPWNSNFRKEVFIVIRDAVQKELPDEYLKRLDKVFSGDVYGLMIKSCVVRAPLSVVTHGDVWVPNFLIKYDGENPGKIVVIDYQLSRYTTLVTDLVFFLYSCVSMDLVETKWNELIEFYHKSLTESMKNYGAKNLFSLDAIHQEIKEHSFMGVGMSMEGLIMSQLEDDEVSDPDGIQGDEAVPLEKAWVVHPFKEQEKRKRIAAMIKDAVDRNFI